MMAGGRRESLSVAERLEGACSKVLIGETQF